MNNFAAPESGLNQPCCRQGGRVGRREKVIRQRRAGQGVPGRFCHLALTTCLRAPLGNRDTEDLLDEGLLMTLLACRRGGHSRETPIKRRKHIHRRTLDPRIERQKEHVPNVGRLHVPSSLVYSVRA